MGGLAKYVLLIVQPLRDFPGGPVIKNLPLNAGDVASIPGWGTKITACLEVWPPNFFLKSPLNC